MDSKNNLPRKSPDLPIEPVTLPEAQSLRAVLAVDTIARKYALGPVATAFIAEGSNGLIVKALPEAEWQLRQIVDKLPVSLEAMAKWIEDQVAKPAKAPEVAAACLAVLALKPNLKPLEREDFIAAFTDAIFIEADVSRVPLCAVVSGLYSAIVASPWLEVSEVVPAIHAAHSRHRAAAYRLRLLDQLRREAVWELDEIDGAHEGDDEIPF